MYCKRSHLADADYEYQKALLAFWTAKADYRNQSEQTNNPKTD
jgi:hypothetical protein